MAEYIERERLKRAISADCQHLFSFDESLYDLFMINIDEIPAADVAPVVRCKGCKFCDDAYCNDGRKLKDLYYCNWFGSVVEKNDFCSYGAKMDLEDKS